MWIFAQKNRTNLDETSTRSHGKRVLYRAQPGIEPGTSPICGNLITRVLPEGKILPLDHWAALLLC